MEPVTFYVRVSKPSQTIRLKKEVMDLIRKIFKKYEKENIEEVLLEVSIRPIKIKTGEWRDIE